MHTFGTESEMPAAKLVLRRWRLFTAIALAAATATLPTAASAQGGIRSTIRDIDIGASLTEQPTDFQEFACGTNGGPASLPIASFAEFARCPAEETGLHEVQFRYDDTMRYVALANLDPLRANLFEGTKLGNFRILASVLIDDAGIVRGVRAVTDDRVSDRTRRGAYAMAGFVHSLYGVDGWECTDIPAAEGETPVGDDLIKQDCEKVTDDGLLITTQSRLLRRPGQTQIDPANGLLRVGYYESTARMEMYEADADGNPIYGGLAPGEEPFAVADRPVPSDPIEAFLGGFSIDCPGCDLAGADLARRNLAGADLSGANLSEAVLHGAVLASANLDDANLVGANLNLVDLKRASLIGADLTDALFYQGDAGAADLTNASLDGIMGENARFTSAKLLGVSWQEAYLLSANLASADLSGATLAGSIVAEADLQRARLVGADVTDATFYKARLRSADLTGVIALHADFLQADLADAIFVDADLTDARLLRARASGLDLTGAILTDTILPDGSVGP